MTNEYDYDYEYDDELSHYGILGQKWGVRRFQDYGGSLTEAGLKRYRSLKDNLSKDYSGFDKDMRKLYSNLGGKIKDAKIDSLDYLNRKGVLDFLDSNFDKPMKDIRSGDRIIEKEDHSGEVDSYVPKAARDPLRAMLNAKRYTDQAIQIGRWNVMEAPEHSNWIGNNAEGYHDLGVAGHHFAGYLKDKQKAKMDDVYKYVSKMDNMPSFGEALTKRINDIDTASIRSPGPRSRINSFLDDYASDPVAGMHKANKAAKDLMDSYASRPVTHIDRANKQYYTTDDHRWRLFKDTNSDGLNKVINIVGTGEGLDNPSAVKIGSFENVGLGGADMYRVNVSTSSEANEYNKWTASRNASSKRYKSDVTDDFINDFIKRYGNEKISHSDFLEHHGTKGQKWGRRQYQNHDGSLTALGRIHYGVGEARKGAKKVAEGTKAVAGHLGGAAASGAKKVAEGTKAVTGKLGGAVRKTVAPTNADLAEKYQKAVDANNRKQLIAATKELQGKKKKLKDMTDQEVMDRFNRLQKEAAIRAMEKEAKKGPVRKFIEENAKAGFNRAMNATIEQAVKNLFAEEKPKKYSDLLNERKAQLGLEVLDGDEKSSKEAAQKLKDLNSANAKPKGGDSGGNKPNDGNKPKNEDKPGNKDKPKNEDKNKSESKKREKTQAWYKEPPEKAKVIKTRIIR